MNQRLITILVAVALVLAGCVVFIVNNDSDDKTPQGAPAPTATPTTAPEPTAAAIVHDRSGLVRINPGGGHAWLTEAGDVAAVLGVSNARLARDSGTDLRTNTRIDAIAFDVVFELYEGGAQVTPQRFGFKHRGDDSQVYSSRSFQPDEGYDMSRPITAGGRLEWTAYVGIPADELSLPEVVLVDGIADMAILELGVIALR